MDAMPPSTHFKVRKRLKWYGIGGKLTFLASSCHENFSLEGLTAVKPLKDDSHHEQQCNNDYSKREGREAKTNEAISE